MNTAILIGRLTKDPELKYTQGNQAIASFTLAVDRNYSKEKKQEMESQGKPTADFIRCVAWGKMAELASRYLRKGLRTCVKGRIQTGSYQHQQGYTVYTTDIFIEQLEFIDWPDQQDDFNQAGQFNNAGQENNSDDDFIPFNKTDGYVPF